MRRRDFIKAIAGATAVWPLVAWAQPSSTLRVGILSPLSPSAVNSPSFEVFRNTLREVGYVEGKNIRFEYRWADSNSERLTAFAAELVSLKVDVIFCGPGTQTAITAEKATATIPIVFVGAGDAVGAGLVASLSRPGGNATGLVNQSQDIAGKKWRCSKRQCPICREWACSGDHPTHRTATS
jgi:putative tryptophan/tyrosine transport system substrate-binding protein